MRFKRIQRPGGRVQQPVPREPPRVIRREAEVCPWCGAVESFSAYATKRADGQILRYSTCTACGHAVVRVVILPP